MTQQINDLTELGGIFLEIEEAFNNADFTKELTALLPVLETNEKSIFAMASSPVGEAWPALSPVTIARKGHDTKLVETGAMKASLTGTTTDSIRAVSHRGLIFGTSDEKSIFHQDGTSRIPQREHVGINDALCDEAVDVIADSTVEKLKG